MPPQPSPPSSDDPADDRTNMSRVDSGKMHGWLVRFQREGVKHGKFFSDRAHGGADDALDVARAWRDERLRELGPAQASDASRMHTAAARKKNRRAVTRTGVTGIGFQVREFSAQRVPYVTAYWLDADGKRHQTSFSIQRHGVDDAVRLAARARAATAEWHGEPPRTEQELHDGVVDRIRELAGPHL